MPKAQHVSNQQPSPSPLKPGNRFNFPVNNHLVITTASHIFAWDSIGIHTIFKSSKNSIVAAREAKDGSGVLAVANKQVVVLHDTKRGQERSWGLDADGDEVRHLEYTTDAKSLFLSTNLTTDIQRYSTERSRLLSPARAHATPPRALAVSPIGHLLVSASDDPPVAYLKDLKHIGAPVLIESRASRTPVSTISFHPERPNMFLLAFRDGTLAAFDATKIRRNQSDSFTNQESVNAGELAHLPKLHRTTSEATNLQCVADAAFLPGYKTRAISAGSDGRCRLIDFADGGVVLRTWHAKAPVTSLAVLSRKSEIEYRNQSAGSRASHIMGGPTSTNNLIAIGRTDGKVHIYDSVGLLLSQQTLSENGERIISVEWAKGLSLRPITDTVMAKNADQLPSVPSEKTIPGKPSVTAKQPAAAKQPSQTRRETTFEHVGLPPELRRPAQQVNQPLPAPTRRFTIHPDEVEEGTVRHTPLAQHTTPKPAPLTKGEYLDLFSPVKPQEAITDEAPVKRVASPPRARPRISTQTFVKSPEPTSAAQKNSVAKPRNLALFPSTDSGSETVHPSAKETDTVHVQQRDDKISPVAQRKRITFKPTSQRRARKSGSFRAAGATSNQNAKVLADLRKMSTVHPAHRDGGVLSAFRAAKSDSGKLQTGPATKENAFRLFNRSVDHVETELDSENALKAYESVHKKSNWPEDSIQESSLNGDIWLTSESDDQSTRRHRRRQQRSGRPPARQTSRSRVDSKGTMSTVAQQPAALSVKPAGKDHAVDGSTDEEMHTADTHISPSGTFSPSSNDVRRLFPRSSSLSPKKGHRPRKRAQRSPPPVQDRTLRELTLNSVQAKSPWARAKAGRSPHAFAKSSMKHRTINHVKDSENYQQNANQERMNEAEPHCEVCVPTRSRVLALETEVARLNGEVLMLKAVLRRDGLPLPSLRQN